MDDSSIEPMEEIEQPSSIRRTLTLRSNAARQVAVNFMPSRQLPHNTIRLRRANSEHNALLEEIEAMDPDEPAAAETQADLIVREMAQHTRLMEDDPGAEELRREALRDLPQGLTMKRSVRAKLSASVSLRSKRRPISMWKRMKYRLGPVLALSCTGASKVTSEGNHDMSDLAPAESQDRFRDFIFSIELWYEAIRNIEGQFGSAVGSYFYFLRWLFAANLVLTGFVLALIVVPQALHNETISDTVLDDGKSGWGIVDFISGKGGYGESLLFYGHYHSGDVSAGGGGPLAYNMPFAYFFTMLCLYLAVFGVLCYRTAYSYRRNFIETSGGLSHVFAGKVFCGWDFGVTSPSAAALTATSIYNELKIFYQLGTLRFPVDFLMCLLELLNEQDKNKIKITFCVKTGHYLTNILVNLIVLSAIYGLGYGFWKLLSVESMTPRWEILLSLTVTAVIAVMPLVFNLVVKLECYKPRTALYVTWARTWLLDVGTLLLLYYNWTQSGSQCWETSFGQEAYRLVLLDCLVSLFLLPVIEVVRALLYKLHPSLPAPEFNIAYNSLTLIYNQAVLWAGLLFSPLLAVAVTLKMLLLFYVKRECALRACRPAGKIWRASQTQTVLYVLVTTSLFATLFAFGSIFVQMPSKHCGPFRSYEFVYEVLTEGVLSLSQHQYASKVLTFVTRPGVIAFVLLFLGVCVYYMRARARAQHAMGRILRHMLVLQARDKDFLLNAIAKVSKGEWLYSPKADESGPNSHTWKYLKEVRKPSNAGFHFDASRLSQRPRSYANDRPLSYGKEDRRSDGETDSSFSWKGSTSALDQTETNADVENGAKKMY